MIDELVLDVNETLTDLEPLRDGFEAAGLPRHSLDAWFAATLRDDQVSDLLAYLREAFAGKPAWQDTAARLAATRSGKYQVSVRPSDGIERGPDNVGAQDR